MPFFAREPFGVQKRLLTFWHLFGVFLASFWRTKKSRRGNCGRQKVAVEKGRQKVVALTFSLSNKASPSCLGGDVEIPGLCIETGNRKMREKI